MCMRTSAGHAWEGESRHENSTAGAATASFGPSMFAHRASRQRGVFDLQSALRRRRTYVVRFEHSDESLQFRAANLRELRAYLRAEYPHEQIVSVRDECGNLAGSPPPAARVDAARRRPLLSLTAVAALALSGLGYSLSWLLG